MCYIETEWRHNNAGTIDLMHMTSQKGTHARWGSNVALPRAPSPSMQPEGQPLHAIPPGWPGPAHWLRGWAPMRSASLTRAHSATSLDPQHGVVVMETWRQCIRSIDGMETTWENIMKEPWKSERRRLCHIRVKNCPTCCWVLRLVSTCAPWTTPATVGAAEGVGWTPGLMGEVPATVTGCGKSRFSPWDWAKRTGLGWSWGPPTNGPVFTVIWGCWGRLAIWRKSFDCGTFLVGQSWFSYFFLLRGNFSGIVKSQGVIHISLMLKFQNAKVSIER